MTFDGGVRNKTVHVILGWKRIFCIIKFLQQQSKHNHNPFVDFLNLDFRSASSFLRFRRQEQALQTVGIRKTYCVTGKYRFESIFSESSVHDCSHKEDVMTSLPSDSCR